MKPQIPYIKAGTFEPGMMPFGAKSTDDRVTTHPLSGKVVKSWHTTNTGPREYMGFGYYRRPIIIDFEDGTSIDAWEDSK